MIMARLFHRIFFLLLLLTCHLALAQDGKWDQALDRYERICNRCIELRERAGRGENIPAESIADLLGQLGSLREMLQGAGSEMTPAQRARYEGIRRRYAEASGAPILPSLPTLSKPSPELSGYRAKVPVLPPRLAGGGVAAGAVVRPHVPKRRNWGGNAILYGGLPDGYGGVFASLHSGRFGAYLKGSATIAPQAYSYTCFSDGTTPSGLIWTSGREALSRYAFSAGGCMRAADMAPGPLFGKMPQGSGPPSATFPGKGPSWMGESSCPGGACRCLRAFPPSTSKTFAQR